MKNKKAQVNPLIIILLIVAVFYFGIFQTGSIVQEIIGGEKTERVDKFDTSLKGIALKGETAFLGTAVAGQDGLIICGANEEIVLFNSYSPSSDSLGLKSTAGVGRTSCENYINVVGNFPKGRLEVTCNLKASNPNEDRDTISSCSVNSDKRSVIARRDSMPETSKIETINLNTENTDVKIEAKVTPGNGGFSSSEITIKFFPDASVTTSITGASITPTTTSQSSQELNIFERFWNWFKNLLGL